MKHNEPVYDYRDKQILVIPDMHMPYHHVDSLDFLQNLESTYGGFDLVVNLGDLVDFHGISFHDSDPDLPSAGDELSLAIENCQRLEALFPEMFIIGSNHGDLPLRKFLSGGLPRRFIRTYNEIFEVGDGWKFVPDLTLKTKSKSLPDIYFHHGIKKNGLQVANQRGQRVVQGHYHTEFNIKYSGNPNTLIWSLQAGCLIDDGALAFAYNKLTKDRPILGAAVIVDGIPVLEPMILNKEGRWIG
jgi:hypothetical protein